MEDKNRYRFVIQSTVILVRSCIGLIWASAGPLLPLIMNQYGISRGSVGWFAAAAPLTIAIVSLPIGIIGARFSLKKTFAVGAFLQAGGILAPFASNYPMLVLTRVLFAIGTAITVPVATSNRDGVVHQPQAPDCEWHHHELHQPGKRGRFHRHCTHCHRAFLEGPDDHLRRSGPDLRHGVADFGQRPA